MAAFTPEQKRFTVEKWACYYTSAEIATAFVEAFSDEDATPERPSSAQLAKYNPEYVNGQNLSEELTALFNETRARFNENLGAIPIASQAFRLRELSALYTKAKTKPGLAADLLAQAAKEVGGMFTQKSPGMTPAEFAEVLREKLGSIRVAIERNVSDPQERDRVFTIIQEAEQVETTSG